ncbi:hypothetical protein QQF64_012235 [Cirrhinus molitorella]|uniref:Uncharacterized protein n=1 Tax=Cirrhinus molitorella TaxID=172907 RepID=A0ABR3LWI9_9TELE
MPLAVHANDCSIVSSPAVFVVSQRRVKHNRESRIFMRETRDSQSMEAQHSKDSPGSPDTFSESRESHYCSACHSRATSTQVCSLSSIRAFLICHFQYHARRQS